MKKSEDISAPAYISSRVSDLADSIGEPWRVKGAVLLLCRDGCSVVRCNFARTAFRKGCLALIFPDTQFSVEKTSRTFSVREFSLSASLTDEATFISSGPFFDWLSEHPVCVIPENRQKDLTLWLEGIDWIERHVAEGHVNVMTRNQWQNFFLGFEASVKPMLDHKEMKTISSSRSLFNRFCDLLCEHSRTRHDVRFYADILCITPYYLSKITHRIFSISPKEMIDRQIIMGIKTLLTTTDLSVKEIAVRYCFESASYLGRFFRRHTGMTPLEYRARQSGQNSMT